MSVPLEHIYFDWLYSNIGSITAKNPSQTFWKLAKQLHNKEFVWLVSNDDNRISDGKDLRAEFLASTYRHSDPYWENEHGCSMLEMLIALSRRLSFETDQSPKDSFWLMLNNIEIARFADKVYNPRVARVIDRALDRVIWRTYNPDGSGGLFPLLYSDHDQRKVELWYQLSAYLLATS